MNTETCWVGNAGRTVRVVLGADFICPGCHLPLQPPAPRRASLRRLGKSAALVCGIGLLIGGAGVAASGLAGNTAVNRLLAGVKLPDLRFFAMAPRVSPALAKGLSDPANRLESALSPVRSSFQTYEVMEAAAPIRAEPIPRATGELSDSRSGSHSGSNSGRHAWQQPQASAMAMPNGRGWIADAAPDARPPESAADSGAMRPRQPGVEIERSPLVVSNELALVPPPKPVSGAMTAQPAVAVQPPALFGRAGETVNDPPAALLADLDTSTDIAETPGDAVAFVGRATPSAMRREAVVQRHTKLRDALREAFGTESEHVTLPAGAAPALPRYPALFAQEYPVGRVSAVCLVAARGSSPDCKVLGTGSSLSLTESVVAWPKAGQVHYKAIAAKPSRAAAVWRPAHGRVVAGQKAAG